MIDSLEIVIKFYIRKLSQVDAPAFKEIRDQNLEFIHTDTPYTLEETFDYLKRNIGYMDTQYYGIFLHSTDKLIGYIRFKEIGSAECYIGMDLDSKYQSQGLGFDIYQTLLENLIFVGYHSVFLRVLETNQRAIWLYEKLGFKHIQYYADQVRKSNGKLVGDHLMVYKKEN